MKINENGTNILLILSKSAHIPFCADLVQQVLRELEALTLDDRQLTGEFPVLIDLLRDETKPKLWAACLSENEREQETAIRLLLLISPRTPIVYHQTIAELLKYPRLANGALVRILNGVHGVSAEHLDVKKGVQLSLEMIAKDNSKLTTRLIQEKDNQWGDSALNQLRNLIQLLELEEKEENPHLSRKLITMSLSKHSVKMLLKMLDECFKRLITHEHNFTGGSVRSAEDSEVGVKKLKSESPSKDPVKNLSNSTTNKIAVEIHLLINILEKIINEVRFNLLQMSDLLRFAQLSVRSFFWVLGQPDSMQKRLTISRLITLLKCVSSSRKGIRAAAIRDLLEGALIIHRELFGGPPFENAQPVTNPGISESMMRLNQNQDVISGTNRSYLHAGLIGQGVRVVGETANELAAERKQNFLDAISACCYDQERTIQTEAFTTLSLLLVEFVSPDVMYNGLPWPEEEFQKVTIERDLQIRRTFKHAPILWPLLSLLAVHRPAMCFCSVLLRALCATVMHQWKARSVEKPFSGQVKHPDLMFVTEKLLELMALGQLLPPPMNHLHHVIGQLDPVEVPQVLKDCVWNYMKDNVPSPVLFECHPSTGLVWRNPVTARPAAQYTDTLRRIMLKRLSTLGSVYHQMFVLPQQQTESQVAMSEK